MKSSLFIICAAALLAVTIAGCTYHEHYYGEERMIDEGVVVREGYIVE